MESQKFENDVSALLIRLDKIGDLVCTLPVDEVFKDSQVKCRWVIKKGLSPLAQCAVPPRDYLELDPSRPFESFITLFKYILKTRPLLSLSFQSPWWVNLACALNFISIRVGVLSQWHSFLFLNKGLRQRRSQALQHESDYNMDLALHAFRALHSFLDPQPIKSIPPTKNQIEISIPVAERQIEKTPLLKLAPSELPLNLIPELPDQYVVLHPGMAGSARNASHSFYQQIGELILETNYLVMTGTEMDKIWTDPLADLFHSHPRFLFLSNISLTQMFYVLSKSQLVIAPSTGVLHIAASLGSPTLGIFSPIQVHHPRRWGQRSEGKLIQVVPQIKCPATHHCLLKSCSYYDCMNNIDPLQVWEEAQRILKPRKNPSLG